MTNSANTLPTRKLSKQARAVIITRLAQGDYGDLAHRAALIASSDHMVVLTPRQAAKQGKAAEDRRTNLTRR